MEKLDSERAELVRKAIALKVKLLCSMSTVHPSSPEGWEMVFGISCLSGDGLE
jgi:hypothetical protein